MAWTTPITDRALSDITNRTSKGFMNVVDWLRIYNNAEYICTLITVLKGVDISCIDLPNPTITTIPTAKDINDFVTSLEILRVASTLDIENLVALKTDYVSGDSEEVPTYLTVNSWENNLQILRDFLVNSSTYEVFCGVAEVGQPRFWQNRFMTPFVKPTAPNTRRVRCGLAICGSGLTRQNGWRQYE